MSDAVADVLLVAWVAVRQVVLAVGNFVEVTVQLTILDTTTVGVRVAGIEVEEVFIEIGDTIPIGVFVYSRESAEFHTGQLVRRGIGPDLSTAQSGDSLVCPPCSVVEAVVVVLVIDLETVSITVSSFHAREVVRFVSNQTDIILSFSISEAVGAVTRRLLKVPNNQPEGGVGRLTCVLPVLAVVTVDAVTPSRPGFARAAADGGKNEKAGNEREGGGENLVHLIPFFNFPPSKTITVTDLIGYSIYTIFIEKVNTL